MSLKRSFFYTYLNSKETNLNFYDSLLRFYRCLKSILFKLILILIALNRMLFTEYEIIFNNGDAL